MNEKEKVRRIALSQLEKWIRKGKCPACLAPIKNHYVDCFKIGKKEYFSVNVSIKVRGEWDEYQCCSFSSPLSRAMMITKKR